jgi:hypothetical protein
MKGKRGTAFYAGIYDSIPYIEGCEWGGAPNRERVQT